MAIYNVRGELIGEVDEPKTYNFMSYNVGNFADEGDHSRYHGNDLEGWITKWIQFFGEYNPDVCLLTESSQYIDTANTELSKERIYLPLYEYVSTYNPSNSWGMALLSNKSQTDIHNGLYTTRVSSESKYMYANIVLNNVDVFIAVTHMNHTVTGSEQESIAARAAQMAELISIANGHDNVIIGGDFNITNKSEYAPFVNAGYTLGNTGIFGDFNTYSEDDPIYPLDNVMIKGDKLKLKDFQVFKGVTERDHLATMAKILIG